jgi:hypothetical protein
MSSRAASSGPQPEYCREYPARSHPPRVPPCRLWKCEHRGRSPSLHRLRPADSRGYNWARPSADAPRSCCPRGRRRHQPLGRRRRCAVGPSEPSTPDHGFDPPSGSPGGKRSLPSSGQMARRRRRPRHLAALAYGVSPGPLGRYEKADRTRCPRDRRGPPR